jgi:hypothetical protein
MIYTYVIFIPVSIIYGYDIYIYICSFSFFLSFFFSIWPSSVTFPPHVPPTFLFQIAR